MTVESRAAAGPPPGAAGRPTYLRAVITAPRQVGFEEVPVPEPGRGEVLVRVEAAALCTWEQRVFAGVDTWSYPLVGGHEYAGRVVAIGPGVEPGLAVGAQVAVAGLKRCGECRACRRGFDNICDNQLAHRVPGKPWGPGGFAEYVLARAYQVYAFPAPLSPLEAAMAEPLACVLHDVKRFPPRRGDTAVIVGGGIMGLLHLAALAGSGANLVVSEPDARRRAKALEMGAHAVVDPSAEDYGEAVRRLSDGHGAGVTYVAIGATQAIQQAVQAAAKRGVVSVYASVHPRGQQISLDPNLFHNREIVLSGSLAQDHEDFLDAVWSIGHRTINLAPLLSAVHPLRALEAAFADAARPDTYRVFVTPDQEQGAASPT